MSLKYIKNRDKIKTLRRVDVCGNCYYRSSRTQFCFRDSIQAWVAEDETCDDHKDRLEKEKERELEIQKQRDEFKAKMEEAGVEWLEEDEFDEEV